MCTCASCSYTDKFAGKGFAEWPRGEPAGPRSSATAYAVHARHCGAKMPKPWSYDPPDAVNFYGTSPGLSRAEVNRVLRQSFGLEPMPEKPEAPKVKPALSVVPKVPKPADDLADFVQRQLAA